MPGGLIIQRPSDMTPISIRCLTPDWQSSAGGPNAFGCMITGFLWTECRIVRWLMVFPAYGPNVACAATDVFRVSRRSLAMDVRRFVVCRSAINFVIDVQCQWHGANICDRAFGFMRHCNAACAYGNGQAPNILAQSKARRKIMPAQLTAIETEAVQETDVVKEVRGFGCHGRSRLDHETIVDRHQENPKALFSIEIWPEFTVIGTEEPIMGPRRFLRCVMRVSLGMTHYASNVSGSVNFRTHQPLFCVFTTLMETCRKIPRHGNSQ